MDYPQTRRTLQEHEQCIIKYREEAARGWSFYRLREDWNQVFYLGRGWTEQQLCWTEWGNPRASGTTISGQLGLLLKPLWWWWHWECRQGRREKVVRGRQWTTTRRCLGNEGRFPEFFWARQAVWEKFEHLSLSHHHRRKRVYKASIKDPKATKSSNLKQATSSSNCSSWLQSKEEEPS